MIRSLSIRNYRSIYDTQTFSFEVDDTNNDAYYATLKVPKNKSSFKQVKLLRLGMIYGANASGKTNILKGFNAYRKLILTSRNDKTEKIDYYDPFKFTNKESRPTEFKLTFFVPDSERNCFVEYCHQISYGKERILNEKLTYKPFGREATFFERNTDAQTGVSSLKLSMVSESIQEKIELELLENISVFAAYNSLNIHIAEIENLIEWYQEKWSGIILPEFRLYMWAGKQILEHSQIKAKVISLLREKADICISDINVVEKNVLQEIIDFFASNSNDLSEEEKNKLIRGGAKQIEVLFEHEVDSLAGKKRFILNFNEESRGTQRYFGLGTLLSLIIEHPRFIPIDELESSLHPDLFEHFLAMYLRIHSHSQLLLTTHYREFLKDSEKFDKGMIWFTEKDGVGATQLFSLADFETNTLRKGNSVYNAYKNGKLGGVPHLGSTQLHYEN